MFGMGEPNTDFDKYFIGNSYLKPLNNPKECNIFLAVEVPGENTSTEWCEEVSDKEYNKL